MASPQHDDWQVFQQRVLADTGSAETVQDASRAIRLALTLLGDRHSYYIPASGPTIFNPQSPSQSTYGGPVDPDEPIDDPSAVVRRAVEWIVGGEHGRRSLIELPAIHDEPHHTTPRTITTNVSRRSRSAPLKSSS
jgi:hypothetical protein